jgi:exopolysaccharide biosynthesis polyprenyl glycosylphosphotransferase
MAADACAIAAAMTLAAWMRQRAVDTPEALTPVILVSALSLPVWLCVFARYKLYTAAAITSRAAETNRILHAVAAASALTGLMGLLFAANISRIWLVFTFIIGFFAVVAERSLVRATFTRARARGHFRRPVVIIGTNAEALSLVQMLIDRPDLGYTVVGLLDCGTPTNALVPGGIPVLGDSRDALEIVQRAGAAGAIVATSAIEEQVANRIARELTEAGCHVELTSGLVDISADRLLTRPLGRRPVLYVEPVRRMGWRAFAKRGFDITLASVGLILISPLLLACAIAIKLDSRGPVFFKQVRVGKDGRLFKLWKLRTMVADAERMLESLRPHSEMDGPLFKMRDDPRVTRVGAFLRRTSIDELPQLGNVLRGEMSMVGPRPALPGELSGWTEELRGRLRVKPGVTGMWQVSGRSGTSFDDYVRHDLYYVDNWSLMTDVAIVAKTIPVVLFRRGAY